MPPPGFTFLPLLTRQPEGETGFFLLRVSAWGREGEGIGTEEVKLELLFPKPWSASVSVLTAQRNGVVGWLMLKICCPTPWGLGDNYTALSRVVV